MGSGKVSDEKIARAAAAVAPVTLPPQAWGAGKLEWFDAPRPVWVWVSWPDRAAERSEGWAIGSTDRVVIVDVPCDGGHWQPVVWRNAVTVRRLDFVVSSAEKGTDSP